MNRLFQNITIFLFFLSCFHKQLMAQTPAPEAYRPMDQVALVFNTSIYTLNELRVIQRQYAERVELAPLVYQPKQSSLEQIAQTLLTQELIRAKLSEVGLEVSDGMVDERIKMITQSQRISEDDLVKFLAGKGLILTEYKAIIKQSLEVSNYLQKFLYPLVDVSDTEAKNLFFEKSGKQVKTQDLLYHIALLALPKGWQQEFSLKDTIEHIKNFQQQGTPLPGGLSSLEVQEVSEVEESSLSKDIRQVLKDLEIGNYGPIVVINGRDTVIFLKDKKTKKNDQFQEQLSIIKNQLLYEKALKLFRSGNIDGLYDYFTYTKLN